MLEKVKHYIEKEQLLSPGGPVLVGLSGGADSVCLLRVLTELGYKASAAHLHHGLRGEEADGDLAFCRSLCAGLGVPFYEKAVDVRALAKAEKCSEEVAGRRARYAYFDSLGIAPVAVAHHMGDQAETVLMRLARGTGLHGLAGMAPRRGTVIRPLLCVTREEIEAYLAAIGQAYRTDSTNQALCYTRNRLRHQVIPALAGENPRFFQTVFHMAEDLREDEAYLQQQAQAELAHHPAGRLDTGRLLSCPRPVAKRVLQGFAGPVSRTELEALLALAAAQSGKQILLENGKTVQKIYNEFTLLQDFCDIIPHDLQITAFGAYTFGGCTIRVSQNGAGERFDSAKLAFPITVRSRRPGDVIKTAGGTKKLQNLFTDLKIPQSKRPYVPVFEAEGTIFWVAPRTFHPAYRANKHTKETISIEVVKERE